MNAQEALTRLTEGNKKFVSGTPTTQVQDNAIREKLTGGQAPYAIILSCADSRVAPELTFDTGIGEIFVLRVAGNVANPSTIASIEYAVAHLGTKLIVVMGHQSCGAVGAAIQGGDNGPNLNKLISYISPAVDELGKDAPMEAIINKNAKNSANTLVTQSTIIANAVKNDGVEIKTAYYSLETGEVTFS